MPDLGELYDEDFYAWTLDQAAKLRAWPEHLRPNGIDIDHLAEEIEDLGRSERHAIQSLMEELALHLLKLEFHPSVEAQNHWRAEVDSFRTQIHRRLRGNHTLRAQRGELYWDVWPDAAQRFRAIMEREVGVDAAVLARLGADQPAYAVDDELLAKGWYPESRPAAG